MEKVAADFMVAERTVCDVKRSSVEGDSSFMQRNARPGGKERAVCQVVAHTFLPAASCQLPGQFPCDILNLR